MYIKTNTGSSGLAGCAAAPTGAASARDADGGQPGTARGQTERCACLGPLEQLREGEEEGGGFSGFFSVR